MAHQWRFFRSGGFDQVRLDSVDDWRRLGSLDKKLWAALSCPVKGLEFDQRTLEYLDSDNDGRVRVEEVQAAVAWCLSVLKQPEVLLKGNELPLAAIDAMSEEGARLQASAQQILQNLKKPEAKALSVDDTKDLSKIFPADQFNGDGVVPEALVHDDEQRQLVRDILASGFTSTDRSGEPGITADQIDGFLGEAKTWLQWREQGKQVELPFADKTADVHALVQTLKPKVDDFFVRCQLAAYDPQATTALNASSNDFADLSRKLLSTSEVNIDHLPIAHVNAEGRLPLRGGVHPHWREALHKLAEYLNEKSGQEELSLEQWQALNALLQPYDQWLNDKPKTAVSALGDERLQQILQGATMEVLRDLSIKDAAKKSEAESVLDVDKLIRYQANLRDLLRNFVNLEQFYHPEKTAVFQNGRLYIDSRSCDLCVEVLDAGKHAKMANHSGTYLLYLDCHRPGSKENKTIVAAVTAGDSGNLMVGRNGIFYDQQGRDWDATVSKIIEHPISVREAFFMPYRRVSRMISEQIQKFAAAKDKEIETKSAAGVGDAAKTAEAGSKAPSGFDIAKFAGIFAAIGLAIGAIGAVLAAVVNGFLGLLWWQMPLAILGIILLISGPSMLLAWFKLRRRNLAPLLDANGWAVNADAKISIAFGRELTALAELPEGSRRSLKDPYEPRSAMPGIALLAVLIIVVWWLWREGLLSQWFG